MRVPEGRGGRSGADIDFGADETATLGLKGADHWPPGDCGPTLIGNSTMKSRAISDRTPPLTITPLPRGREAGDEYAAAPAIAERRGGDASNGG